MTREADLWRNLKRAHKKMDMGQLCRVEMLGQAGWPDVYSLHYGKTRWIELKHIPAKPARVTTKITSSGGALDPAQVEWHTRCHENGGVSFVLTNCWDEGYLLMSNDRVKVYNQLQVSDLKLQSSLREVLCKLFLA